MTRLLAEICENQYFLLNLKIRSDKTRYQYGIALRCFARSLGHEPTTDDLTDDSVTLWMGRLLRQEPPLSVNTVRERVNRVLALWGWLARRGVVSTWPTVVKPDSVDTLPQALSEPQLRALFESAAKERGHIGGIPAALWWLSFLSFVWTTSERKGAAMSVKIPWLDLSARVCSIPPDVRKGRRKWGIYPLWPETIPLLERVIAVNPSRELVWPWDRHEGSYYTAYNRILKDAGLPVSRKTKTHGLRVSHATWLKVAGGDPTRKLMHGSSETTDRHYIDPRMIQDTQPRLFVPWDTPPDKPLAG